MRNLVRKYMSSSNNSSVIYLKFLMAGVTSHLTVPGKSTITLVVASVPAVFVWWLYIYYQEYISNRQILKCPFCLLLKKFAFNPCSQNTFFENWIPISEIVRDFKILIIFSINAWQLVNFQDSNIWFSANIICLNEHKNWELVANRG